jgi:polyphosphate kinase 2 (PPK2 family)
MGPTIFAAAHYRYMREPHQRRGENGTLVIKFFLHLSKEEHRTGFLARIDEPDKNWKFSASELQSIRK